MKNHKLMKRLPVIFLTLVLFAFPATVHADVAPPINPPGSNLQPGSETTQVRMVAETVQIEVKANDSLGAARVTAGFTMRNLGSASESMAVRFPISSDDGTGGNYPEITDLVIIVNGKQVPFQRANYPDINYHNETQKVPWAEFNVTFPVGQDVPIQVAYNLTGSGYMPFTAFYYLLETGAGWKDTIGSADIILRLPYPASQQNVIMNFQIGWALTTPGGVIQGNEVRWHFDNFEPGLDGPVQNMEFALVAPVIWQNVLKARDNVAKNPTDSEAWGQLAKSYKEIFLSSKGYRTDPGGVELYQASIEAYQKCLALNPKDAEWHAGFADLLAGHSYWDSWYSNPTAEVYRALDEIHTALALAPNDAIVLQVAQNIAYMFPNAMSQNGTQYEFPWLTQTPTLIPPTPTIVPVLDPAVVSGTYQTDTLTLRNGKKAQLILTLGADYSAEMETKYEIDPPVMATGSWTDNGDHTLSIAVTDPSQKKTEITFNVSHDMLLTNTYPAVYGEAGVDMHRLAPATSTPTPTAKPQPTPTVSAPTEPAPTIPAPTIPAPAIPASQPSLPICGSAVIIIVILLALKRR